MVSMMVVVTVLQMKVGEEECVALCACCTSRQIALVQQLGTAWQDQHRCEMAVIIVECTV